jgi:hypothetical protein
VTNHVMEPFLRHYLEGIPVTASSLIALPNPVPPGAGQGKTTITWCSGRAGSAAAYVSRDGAEPVVFARSSHGSQEARWIQAGSTYEFSLYAGPDRKSDTAFNDWSE